MGLLALDIGTRKTGLAYGETNGGFVIALDTIRHETMDDLLTQVRSITRTKSVQRLIVGLPLLLDGREGEQATLVRSVAEALALGLRIPVEYIDERYTNQGDKNSDDCRAACAILSTYLDRKK